MKKILTFAASFSVLMLANAQTQKGCKLIGTSLGSMSMTNSESTTTYSNTPTVYKSTGRSVNLSINPTIAWFVADNIAIGGYVGFSLYHSSSKSSNTSSTTTSTNTYNNPSFYLGPMARFYFGGGEKGKPFAEVGVQSGVYGGKSKSETSTGASSQTTTIPKFDRSAVLRLGFEHFFSSWVGMFGSIGLQFSSSETKYEYRPSTGTGYDYTSSYKNIYTPITLGLQIHCPGKKKN